MKTVLLLLAVLGAMVFGGLGAWLITWMTVRVLIAVYPPCHVLAVCR